MADGFVFANLTLFFGGIGGVAGVGMVILIMVLANFSGMVEILSRKMATKKNFREDKKIAFVPHSVVIKNCRKKCVHGFKRKLHCEM